MSEMTPEKAQALLDGSPEGPWHLEPRIRKTQRQRYVKSADDRFVADALPDALAMVIAAPDLAQAYIDQAAEVAALKADVDTLRECAAEEMRAKEAAEAEVARLRGCISTALRKMHPAGNLIAWNTLTAALITKGEEGAE